ncbi:unnamed protein product [Didymodactylos carnosus]|uniref:Uncharacterized protein n=1 Tax=Didymodactylos carnosus TaxID=1234261 RepID=A0A813WLG4_9BILA|nr:unnamed protein product [Didymodactylos carnosus]CAF3650709.1 unnamed protein product [Didymodactylos carnosus]
MFISAHNIDLSINSIQQQIDEFLNQLKHTYSLLNETLKKTQFIESQILLHDDTDNTVVVNKYEQIIEDLFSKLDSIEQVLYKQWQQIQMTIFNYELWLKK